MQEIVKHVTFKASHFNAMLKMYPHVLFEKTFCSVFIVSLGIALDRIPARAMTSENVWGTSLPYSGTMCTQFSPLRSIKYFWFWLISELIQNTKVKYIHIAEGWSSLDLLHNSGGYYIHCVHNNRLCTHTDLAPTRWWAGLRTYCLYLVPTT